MHYAAYFNDQPFFFPDVYNVADGEVSSEYYENDYGRPVLQDCAQVNELFKFDWGKNTCSYDWGSEQLYLWRILDMDIHVNGSGINVGEVSTGAYYQIRKSDDSPFWLTINGTNISLQSQHQGWEILSNMSSYFETLGWSIEVEEYTPDKDKFREVRCTKLRGDAYPLFVVCSANVEVDYSDSYICVVK